MFQQPGGTKAPQGETHLLRNCCASLDKTLSLATCLAMLSNSQNNVARHSKGLQDCLRPPQFSEEITMAQDGEGAWLITQA